MRANLELRGDLLRSPGKFKASFLPWLPRCSLAGAVWSCGCRFRGGEVPRCPGRLLTREGSPRAFLPSRQHPRLPPNYSSLRRRRLVRRRGGGGGRGGRCSRFSGLYLGIRYVFHLRTIYKSKQKLAIKPLCRGGAREPQIPLGMIDGAWRLPCSRDDAQPTLWRRGTAAPVGSGKGEGNTAVTTGRIMFLKGIIVATMPLTFFCKLWSAWSLLEV